MYIFTYNFDAVSMHLLMLVVGTIGTATDIMVHKMDKHTRNCPCLAPTLIVNNFCRSILPHLVYNYSCVNVPR